MAMRWVVARYLSSTILRCHSPRAYLPVDQAPFYACLLLKYGFVLTLWMQRPWSPSGLATRALFSKISFHGGWCMLYLFETPNKRPFQRRMG